jgi:DNA-directed RNA polymerase specialized sigma subunit
MITYTEYFYEITKAKRQKRCIEAFKKDLPVLIKKYRDTQNKQTFCDILLMIDGLIMRMIFQLREQWKYLKNIEMQELYNTSTIALHNACNKFEIRDENSIYSFPIFLKTYIDRELRKTFLRKNDDITDSMRDTDIEEVNKRIVVENIDRRIISEIVESLVYKGVLKPQYACILKLRMHNKSSSEIAKRMRISISRSSFLYNKSIEILKEKFKKDIDK